MNALGVPPLSIIVSPHFDDAIISLGGFLAQRPGEAIVLTVFGGKPVPAQRATGWAAQAGFRTSDEEFEARSAENHRALGRFSATACNLPFLDQPYRDSSLDASLAFSVAQQIGRLVESYGQRRIHLYGPAALPRCGSAAAHTDHRIVHDAVSMVFKQRLENVRGFFYEDIPYAASAGSVKGSFKDLLESTDHVSLVERIVPLTSGELLQKMNGIGDYASQIRAARRRGEDFRSLARQFARARGSHPRRRCDACEVVYEILDPGEPCASLCDHGTLVRGGRPLAGSRDPAQRVAGRSPTGPSGSTSERRSCAPGALARAEGTAAAAPLVTAVMVTYRSVNYVGSALNALYEGFRAGILRCIVVDNDSADGTADYVAREHPWVELIRSPRNLGYGRGCNLGLEQVQTPYVLVMNPDVIIERDSVETLARFMEGHPKAGMAAPSTLAGGNLYQHVGGLPTPWSIVAGASGFPGRPSRPQTLLPASSPFRTDWLCGAVMLIRTNVIRELGGFDPRFFLYFEETDLCLRTLRAGHELWAVGKAKAVHAGGLSARKVDPSLEPGQDLAIHFFPSRYYYLTKHHGRIAAMMTEAAELLVKAVRDVLRPLLGRPFRSELRTRLRAPVFTVPPLAA